MDNYTELVERTSWVDANLAYRQIIKGNATGNKAALLVRGHTQTYLFNLGCFVDKNSWKVLLVGCITLAVLTVGLRSLRVETKIDKLWVAADGRLEKELAYTKSVLGEGSGTTSSIVLQTADNGELLSQKALLQHYKHLRAATNIRVVLFSSTWKFTDLCYKPAFPSFEESLVDKMIDQLIPCVIITPLDCFWEGSKLLGPEFGISFKGSGSRMKWTNLNPKRLVGELRNMSAYKIAHHLEDALKRGGITTGYQYKPCLDPNDEECPKTAPNYHSKKVPNIGGALTGGCEGFSSRYMRWNEELIVGNSEKNKTGHIYRADALQSIVQLMGEHDMYEYYKDTNTVRNIEWTQEKAKLILTTWQRRFMELTTELDSSNHTGEIYTFSGVTVDDLIADFTAFRGPRLVFGCALMLLYVCLAMLKWNDCVASQAGLAMAGVLLMVLSIAAGFGIGSAIGIEFNAASTQIIPFLALGLSVNHVFLMLSVLAERVQQKDLSREEVTASVLKSTGVSIIMTSLCISAIKFLAALIPIPALRAFSIQAAIIVLINMTSLLIVYPAIISIDVRRRQYSRIDVFCCFKATVNTVQELRPDAFHQMPHARPQAQSAPQARTISSPPQSSLCTYNQGSKDPYTTTIANTGSGKLPIRNPAVSGIDLSRVQALRDSKFMFERPVFSQLPPRESNSRVLPVERNMITPESEERSRPNQTKDTKFVWSIDNVVRQFYIPLLLKTPCKILVMVFTGLSLCTAGWNISQVKDGLRLMDIVPRDTPQYNFFNNEAKYFGYYHFHAVTKGEIDYPNQQELLSKYHQSFQSVTPIMRKKDGTLPDYWLSLFRNWLLDLQKAFDHDVSRHLITTRDWEYNATEEGILAYKLLVQTGDIDTPIDKHKVMTNRLVKDGIINPEAFYNYLSAWYSNDAMAYDSSEALIHPQPAYWIHVSHDFDFIIPKSKPITFAQMPLHLIHLRDTDNIISVVKKIRTICDSYRQAGLENYPSGLPFTFWEQYLDIRLYLSTALVCSLICVLLVLAFFFFSFWAALMVVLHLTVMIIEVFGFMGIMGIRLSAVPAVIIILAVGVGVDFTLHVMMGFVTAVGSREERVAVSLEHVTRPIVHGAVSTFMGIFMLAFSEFEFILSYFFGVMGALLLIGLINGLVTLPVFLAAVGPPAEVIPVDMDVFMVSLKTKDEPQVRKSRARRHLPTRLSNPSLSTITEEPSCLQSSHEIIVEPNVVVSTSCSSGRDSTPPFSRPTYFHPVTTTVRAETKVTVEVYNPYHLPGQMDG